MVSPSVRKNRLAIGPEGAGALQQDAALVREKCRASELERAASMPVCPARPSPPRPGIHLVATRPYGDAMRRIFAITIDAYLRFSEDDGWPIASHIALSTLTSMFPFLIFLTALAGVFGSKDLADQAAAILLDDLAAAGRRPDRRGNPQRSDRQRRQPRHRRRRARAVFLLERHRSAAGRPQPRLSREGSAAVVAVAARIDRLCPGRRAGPARLRLFRRPRAAHLGDGAHLCAGARAARTGGDAAALRDHHVLPDRRPRHRP